MKAVHPAVYVAALLGFVAILPQVSDAPYLLHVIVVANILAVFALSWDVVAGFMGQINFGQAMFFGVGAYTIGLMSTAYRVPPILGLIIGGLVAVLLSLIVGIPCLRLRGPYYAIATLAFSQVLFTLCMGLPDLTGSEEGIGGIPKFIETIEGNYYFSFLLLLMALVSLRFLLRSVFGKRLISIREDDSLGEAAGIDTSKYKIIGSAISAFIAGVVGAYSSHYHTHVSPDSLSIGLTFSVIAMVVFGGMGTLYGPVIGAYVLTLLNEYLYFMMEYRLLIYPLAIMLILLFSPAGLLGFLRSGLKVIRHDTSGST
jgi:branched-chain amino acid transport system permease protein